MTQWAPAVIRGPLVSWAPSRQGAPSRTGGPLLGEILGTCLMAAVVGAGHITILLVYVHDATMNHTLSEL